MVLAILVIAPLLLTPGDVGARTNDAPVLQTVPDASKVVIRPLTESEWNRLKPRAQWSQGASASGDKFTDGHITSIHGGVNIGWAGVGYGTNVLKYQVSRRLAAKTGQAEYPWQFLESRNTTQVSDADGAPGFYYDYLIKPVALGTPPASLLLEDVVMAPRGQAYGFGTGTTGLSIYVSPTIKPHSGILRITRHDSPKDPGTVLGLTVGDPFRGKIVRISESNLEADRVYSYKIEYVEWNTTKQIYEFVDDADPLFIKTGAPTTINPPAQIASITSAGSGVGL